MKAAGFLKKLLPLDDLKLTVQRFPESALCTLALLFLVLSRIHDTFAADLHDLWGRLVALCVFGFVWFGVVRVMAEAYDWTRGRQILLAFGVYILFSILVLFESGFALVLLMILMMGALLLLLGVAPYLRGEDNLSLWFFNQRISQGSSAAALAGLVWGGGTTLVLISVHKLFDLQIHDKVYADIWALALLVLAPLYGLAWVPRSFKFTEEDCHAPPQLAFLLNWILAPLVLVYMLILYAYIGKIAVMQEMPRGVLSWMITIFGGVGILTYVTGWPLRQQGGALLRAVYKVFFPAMILPSFVLFFAIWQRIDQYGLTHERYMVVLAGIWLMGLALAYTIRRWPLKHIYISLAVLLVLAAYGPLSALSFSAWSQYARLEAQLVKHGILVDGKIVKLEEGDSLLPTKDRSDISSSISYLAKIKKLDKFEDWLPDMDLTPRDERYSQYNVASRIATAMGITLVNEYDVRADSDAPQRIFLMGTYRDVFPVAGYDWVMDLNVYGLASDKEKEWKTAIRKKAKDSDAFIEMSAKDGVLSLRVIGHAPIEFDIRAYAEEQYRKDPDNLRQDGLTLEMEKQQGALRIKLVFSEVSGKLSDGKLQIDVARGSLLVAGAGL